MSEVIEHNPSFSDAKPLLVSGFCEMVQGSVLEEEVSDALSLFQRRHENVYGTKDGDVYSILVKRWKMGYSLSDLDSVHFKFYMSLPLFVLNHLRNTTYQKMEFSLPSTLAVYRPYVNGALFHQPVPRYIFERLDPDQKKQNEEVVELFHKAGMVNVPVYEELIKRGVPADRAESILPIGTFYHGYAEYKFSQLLVMFANNRKLTSFELSLYTKRMLEILLKVHPKFFSFFIQGGLSYDRGEFECPYTYTELDGLQEYVEPTTDSEDQKISQNS